MENRRKSAEGPLKVCLVVSAIGVVILAGFVLCVLRGVKHVDTYECPVCRLKQRQERYLGIPSQVRFETNAFSEWYAKHDQTHIHTWLPRASTAYNCFGAVRYVADFTQHRFFSIDPADELGFLKDHFSLEEVKVIAKNLQRDRPAEGLYFAIYSEGTNAGVSLDALRSWLRTNAMGSDRNE